MNDNLDVIREESNKELCRDTVMSEHDVTLVNALIDIRNAARKVAKRLSALEEELAPKTKSEIMLAFAKANNIEVIDIPLSSEPINLLGLPSQVEVA